MYETYISDDYNEGCVIFPLEGEPVVINLGVFAGDAGALVARARRDVVVGRLSRGDQRHRRCRSFSEKKLAENSLGVVGLSSQAPTEIYGASRPNFWAELTAALPKARWQDISEEFSHLMLVKSDEELAQVRYAARAAEAACKVIAEVAAPASARKWCSPKARAKCCATASACAIRDCHELRSAHLSWGPPRWTTSGEAPRILQRGDLMQAELMPLCGNRKSRCR